MTEEGPEALKSRIAKVLDTLALLYSELRPGLTYETPFQLLVATVLSAQCTDAMVNRVTPALFARYPTPADLALADQGELEKLIHSTGFFRAKSRNLRSLSSRLWAEHGGSVPDTMVDLTALPGVGRKTAGVVLSACFGAQAIIVDTHFLRVSKRMGFTRSADPLRVEEDLAALIAPERWTEASHILNRHGRSVCPARKPRCSACPVAELCPFPSFSFHPLTR